MFLVADLVEGGGDCCEERDVEVEEGGKGGCEVRCAQACARSRGR